MAERYKRSEKISIMLGLLSVGVTIFFPYRLALDQSVLQHNQLCSTALLEFRKAVAPYIALGTDSTGNVRDGESKPTRLALQSARDTVYVLCVDVINNSGDRVVGSDLDYWRDSPRSLEASWQLSNVNDLYRESSTALAEIVEIRRPWYSLV